jgi:PHS family inorganic phosphate transporter-like MFS transporter
MNRTVNGETEQRNIFAELDASGITRMHWKMVFVSGMGLFTDAYDLFVIGIVLALLRPEWHLAAFQVALIGSTSLLAAALGSLIFGRCADVLGRKRIYGYELLILALGALASSFAPNIVWLIVCRFVLGVGVGGDYPVSATIVSEYAGTKARGLLISLVFAMQGVGLIVGPAVAILLLRSGISHDLAWRLMLGLGAIPGLSVFYLRRQIHETPRFSALAGGREPAQRACLYALTAFPRRIFGDGATRDSRHFSSDLEGYRFDPVMLRWLLGASVSWFLLDVAYYGNTLSRGTSSRRSRWTGSDER